MCESLNCNPEQFWELTPKLFWMYKEMTIQKEDIRKENQIVYAYYSALFQRADKPQKLLDTLLPDLKELRKIDNQDLLIASFKDLNATLPKKSWEEWVEDGVTEHRGH